MTIDKQLTDLHPKFQPLAQRFLDAYRATGRRIEIGETWRDPKREDQLHDEHITACTGENCKHCFMIDGKPASKAMDFQLFDENNDYITDGTDGWYADAGDIATSLGLTWGGNFVHAAKDWDHIEAPDDILT